MKLLSILLIILLLSSCESTHILSELKPAKPVVAIRQNEGNTRDAEWERIMRLFADHDIPIKTVDKSSGFIESDVMSFVKAYSIDGLQNTGADTSNYVITQREYYGNTLAQPDYITGQIKIFITHKSEKMEVQVSIENLKNFYICLSRYYKNEVPLQVYSTGTLENKIADYITFNTDSVDIRLLKGVVINPNENRYAIYKSSNSKSLGAAIGTLSGIFVAAMIAIGIAAAHSP